MKKEKQQISLISGLMAFMKLFLGQFKMRTKLNNLVIFLKLIINNLKELFE